MAKAPSSSLEPKSRDWVPLFIAFATARGSNSITDTETASHPSPDSDPDSESDSDSDTDPRPLSSALTKTKSDNCVLKSSADAQAHAGKQKVQQRRKPHGVHVGAKVWRSQLREWLVFVGGVKGAKGMFRTDELKQCVVKQLQDTDSGVQQAALRSLQVHTIWLFLQVSGCLSNAFCQYSKVDNKS